tara:strand:- start:110 stop:856 length:747 start_codon:yes stop_codon:yes gene_type:complete
MILDMSNENDTFDWDWISDRRNSEIQLKQTLKSAPSSWKKWIQGGAQLSLGLQRKIYKPLIVPATQQRKIDKSKKALLEKIYHYYDNNKHSFEFLAAYITERIIALDGSNYRLGWITSKASDGGIDFVGKIAIGKNISSVDIVVLGQAKCIKPKSSVSPIYLARTVSRLKRGWIGSFVTTGVFSDQAQKEVYNDKYPLMLINGSLVADIVASSLHIEKISNVEKFLQQIDNVYSDKVMNRRAEEAVYI